VCNYNLNSSLDRSSEELVAKQKRVQQKAEEERVALEEDEILEPD
jgi:hypothetical protein